MKPRVVLLTEIPAPYRIPLFNALAERVDLLVVFLAAAHPERPYDLHEGELRFRRHVLPSAHMTYGTHWLVLNRRVLGALRDADVVVLGGWNQPAFWLALAAAKLARKRVVAWVESTLRDRRVGRTAIVKRMFAHACDAFVVPGAAAADYVRTLAPRARIVTAPNAVDASLFASRVGERDALRAELGIDGACFLYVGRLSPEKGVDVLLRAFEGVDGELVLAGDGPEEQRLRALAPPRTNFLGHVERDELPRWYAAADVLVLPSRSDVWGMTLNEGAAAGLPLVATDVVGATQELVEPGRSGIVVPADDVEALHTALSRLAADPGFRALAGARSRELAERLTPERWANTVSELCGGLARRRP